MASTCFCKAVVKDFPALFPASAICLFIPEILKSKDSLDNPFIIVAKLFNSVDADLSEDASTLIFIFSKDLSLFNDFSRLSTFSSPLTSTGIFIFSLFNLESFAVRSFASKSA